MQFNITDSSFENNEAVKNGGAIANGDIIKDNKGGKLVIDNTSFNNNSATDDLSNGGAIFNYGGTLELKNGSSFESNSANSGGAIANFDADVSVDDTTFTSNTASLYGGAIYNISNTDLNIEKSAF